MAQGDNIERKKDEQPKNPKNAPDIGLWLTGVCSLIVLAALIAISLIFRQGHKGVPQWVNFLTVNVLSLLLLDAVIVQAYIYFHQWKLLRIQLDLAINPRLRIASVALEDFEMGKSPAFIVTLVNEGATDARDVALHLRAQSGLEDNVVGAKWSREQIVTIPANGKQNYFVRWQRILRQEQVDAFNNAVPLQVSGYFKYPEVPAVEFCYRYYPWHGKRPDGIAQFVPCDFDPGLTILIKAEGGIRPSGDLTGTVIKSAKQKERGKDKSPN